MKSNITTLIALIVFSAQGFTQESYDSLKFGHDKELCEQNLSIYTEFYKQKNYLDAYKPWAYLYRNAPKRTKNLYLHGPKIIKALIETTEDADRKTSLIDTLTMIYDQRNMHYPGKEAYVLGMKGADMYRYMKTTTTGLEASYEVLLKSFNMAGNKSSASVLNYYFMVTTKLVQAKVLKVEDLIALFSDLSGVIAYKEAKLTQEIYNAEQKDALNTKEKKALIKSKKELETLGSVKSNIEKTLAPHATCEKLVDLYSKNYDDKK